MEWMNCAAVRNFFEIESPNTGRGKSQLLPRHIAVFALRFVARSFFHFDLAKLVDAPDVSAVGKWCVEEYLHDLPDLILTEQIGTQAQHVAMIVLAGDARGDLIVRESGADAENLIRRDGHSNAAAVQQDGALNRAIG